jgi:glycosyltransferase involved in cell wall biosynthesis
MPNVLIEAAALGRPVVATDVEGVREVVIDGRTGFVTPCYDAASFAQACLRLLSNPMLCEKMGQEARRHARAVFSPSHHVEMVLNLYAELLTKKGFATADL